MFLGLDIGTSGVKAAIMDEKGVVLDSTSAPLLSSRAQPGWSEQCPDDWWQAVEEAVAKLDSVLRREVRGVGLSGQMHGATLLGADDQPIRSAILWNDTRSHIECAELTASCPDLHTIAGNLAMPGFTAPKLLWLRKHEPAIFARARTILLPKDWVRLRMTGEKVSEMSDASGTLWLDVKRRAWSDHLLEACGLDLSYMPRLAEGPECTGKLRSEVADRWGMAQVPVAGGAGDNAAGAVGIGAVAEGDALLSLGTSGVIFVATGEFRSNPARAVHAFCHCLPGLWHQMSVHLSAASCVDWVARLTGSNNPAEVFVHAEKAGLQTGDELFLPYLSGERTPHNDALVRGAFLRLDNDSSADQLCQAVLEGVAFGLADGLDALRDAGNQIRSLAVIGGGSRSPYWGRILAAAMETTLIYLSDAEIGPALGAARLAQLAVDGGDLRTVCHRPPVSHIIEPDSSDIALLAPKKAAFRAAYSCIKPLRTI